MVTAYRVENLYVYFKIINNTPIPIYIYIWLVYSMLATLEVNYSDHWIILINVWLYLMKN